LNCAKDCVEVKPVMPTTLPSFSLDSLTGMLAAVGRSPVYLLIILLALLAIGLTIIRYKVQTAS
jgi:hypothetical protein